MLHFGQVDRRWVLPPFGLALLAMIAGLWEGVYRGGLGLSPLPPGPVMAHGPLMVSGMVGTVISLERAVGSGERWPFLAPYLSGAGALVYVFTPFKGAGLLAIAAASLLLTVVIARFYRVQKSDGMRLMAVGAALWAAGNLLVLLGLPTARAVFWWAGFLIMTVIGERLELSRMRPRAHPVIEGLIRLAVGLYLVSLAATLIAYDVGIRAAGAALAAIAALFAYKDIARTLIKGHGLPRYAAWGILSGYVWLAIAGLIQTCFGGAFSGWEYDALVHAQFLGFVLSMIMAHAPVIAPAIFGVRSGFHPLFYAPFTLLHLSLSLRVASDLLHFLDGRRVGIGLNVASLLLFMGVNLWYYVLRPREHVDNRFGPC